MLVEAPAKLNLSLEVLGLRSDGYHEVRTVMQEIDLADELEIVPADSLVVRCDDSALNGEENIVWRAAVELAKEGGRLPLAEITLRKRIPVAMGLGGGSSDAAAALVALDRFWKLDLPLERLAAVASRIGSDVSFFLWGGAALASGRGNVIEPLPSQRGVSVSLICPEGPGILDKTARLYGRLNPGHFSDGGVTRRLVQSLMAGQCAEDLFHNVFESLALQEFPGLSVIIEAVESAVGRRPHLSGAGPALFLYSSSQVEHETVVKALQGYQAQAYFVRTLGRSAKPVAAGYPDN
ncbi:MAG: 4-(cytidine 5'-diphospho)-2-C-methyl-D-erythritol kinase [Chloroflexi bacterium]|nr:4-(cytidine 5'-diphospho)-2-C-methyl-D-erythritol kinase [Chloroflexota bacterium]